MKTPDFAISTLTLLCTLTLFSAAAIAQTPAADAKTPSAATTPANALPDAPSAIAHEEQAPVPTGPTVLFDTSMGRLTCKLFDKESPVTVANFIGLATGTKAWTDPVTLQKVTSAPFYDGTTFHRVIPGFMIQGGDRLGTGLGDAGYYIANEISPALRFDVPGRLAMANAGPDTNSSQFFITETPQPQLDGGYTIFGQCDPHTVLMATGISLVDRDANDKPLTPVVLNKVTIVPDGQPLPPLPSPATPSVTASDTSTQGAAPDAELKQRPR